MYSLAQNGLEGEDQKKINNKIDLAATLPSSRRGSEFRVVPLFTPKEHKQTNNHRTTRGNKHRSSDGMLRGRKSIPREYLGNTSVIYTVGYVLTANQHNQAWESSATDRRSRASTPTTQKIRSTKCSLSWPINQQLSPKASNECPARIPEHCKHHASCPISCSLSSLHSSCQDTSSSLTHSVQYFQ